MSTVPTLTPIPYTLYPIPHTLINSYPLNLAHVPAILFYVLTSLNDYMTEMSAKKKMVGSWGFNSNRDFSKVSSEETNVWFFEQVFNYLRSFFGLVLPDNMELITYNASKHIKKDNLEQQTFLDELMLIMKNLKEPLWTLRLNMNLVGFLRTHHDPDNIVRIQIKEPSSFIVWGGPDETGFQTFSISYTLFNDSVLEGTDEMLWSVNQPILEKAIKKWERQTGHRIEVVESNSSKVQANRYGFKRPGGRQPFGQPLRKGVSPARTSPPVSSRPNRTHAINVSQRPGIQPDQTRPTQTSLKSPPPQGTPPLSSQTKKPSPSPLPSIADALGGIGDKKKES